MSYFRCIFHIFFFIFHIFVVFFIFSSLYVIFPTVYSYPLIPPLYSLATVHCAQCVWYRSVNAHSPSLKSANTPKKQFQCCSDGKILFNHHISTKIIRFSLFSSRKIDYLRRFTVNGCDIALSWSFQQSTKTEAERLGLKAASHVPKGRLTVASSATSSKSTSTPTVGGAAPPPPGLFERKFKCFSKFCQIFCFFFVVVRSRQSCLCFTICHSTRCGSQKCNNH